MGIFDKAKEALGDHPDQVGAGIDKAGDFVDDKTGGKYADRVDQGQDLARDKAADYLKPESEPPA